MKTLSSALAAHLAGGATTLCHCWQVARKDGTVMGFTDHDRDVVIDAVTYRAASGFTATAVEDQLGLAVSNLNVDGALSSAAIIEADLSAGLYDDAAVTIMRVNWQDVTQRVVVRSGYLGQVSRGETIFSAELRGLAARLDQTAGRVFQRTCAWELGDSRCTIDLTAAANHGAGTVVSVVSTFEFTASGLSAFASGIFSRGKIVWTSGANAGLAIEVRAQTLETPNARFTLFLPMPRAIQAGDAFTITAGCDKLLATCRDRFSNVVNFGGFPHIPGNDFALSYASKDDKNDGGSFFN
ncbi:MAG: DUF2163 domain-containing protein [Rhizobiales bacterium]|nr:DUF2163 domain-containing protein [Hyphomicrobiales bacterium]MBI3672551.1 DUF2163 domain-containing protein [Hyphomicrobiales bacterium]